MPTYTVPANVVFQTVGGEAVLLNLDSGEYFGLDDVGSRMLELVREQGDPDTVVQALAQEFDATVETLRSDLNDLLRQLEEHGLVEQAP